MKHFFVRFPCTHLPVDPLGMGYGPSYVPKIKAGRKSSHTTDYLRFSRKNGCFCDCLGTAERDMMFILEVSPFVAAYRFQYPWALERARKRIDDYIFGLTDIPPQLRAADVISMDVVITAMPSDHNLEYFIASHKLLDDMGDKKVRRRIALESSEAAAIGFHYFVFSRTRELDIWGLSAKQIYLWGKGIDFNASREAAHALSQVIYKRYQGESAGDCLEKMGAYFNRDTDTCFQLFSVAISLGYLFVDLRTPIRASRSFRLVSPASALPPWEILAREGRVKILPGRSFPYCQSFT